RRFLSAQTSLLTPYRPLKGMRVARASSGPKIPRHKRGRIYEMGYFALSAVMLLVAPGCSKQTAAGSTRAAAGTAPGGAVMVATVADQTMERAVAVIGSLAAHDEATLSVKVPGRLQTLAVDLGSSVRRGELVAQVEPKDYELQLTQAEALLS